MLHCRAPCTNHEKELAVDMSRILQLNCQGAFRYKASEVVDWLERNDGVMAAISETHLCEEQCTKAHACAVVPQLPGWQWIGRPRNIQGGGVGFLIKDSVTFQQRPDLRTQEVEDEWIEVIEKGRPSYFVCSVYVTPKCVKEMMAFRQNLTRVLARYERVLVMGDLNARCLALGDKVNNVLAPHLQDLIDETNLQVCNEPQVATRKGSKGEQDSIPDLTLVSMRLRAEVSEWGVYEEFSSDHMGVSFKLPLPGLTAHKVNKRRVWDFNQADWEKFRELLANELCVWRETPWVDRGLDTLYSEFVCILLAVAMKSIPKRWVSRNAGPRLNQKVRDLKKERKRAVRVKASVDSELIRARISELGKQITQEIKKEGERRIQQILEVPPGAKAWSMWENYGKLTKRAKQKIGVIEVNGERIVEDSGKAESLNEFFLEVGADRRDDVFDGEYADRVSRYVSSFDFEEESKDQTNENFDEKEVAMGLRELNAHKAIAF